VLDYHSTAEYRHIVHFAEIFYQVAMEPFFRAIWRDLVGE
jgi:hypothetical protein